MVTITTTINTKEMKDIALANSVGKISVLKNSIQFKMTDKMFKSFYRQSGNILGYNAFNDENIKFDFHNDQYPLLD